MCKQTDPYIRPKTCLRPNTTFEKSKTPPFPQTQTQTISELFPNSNTVMQLPKNQQSSPLLITPTLTPHRRIAIAVDLSDESAFAVKWAIQNYLRPGDTVILLHVRPTNILYGADWGSVDPSSVPNGPTRKSQQQLEDDFESFTTTKATHLAQPLEESQIPFKIHIVKDHDMKERLCLEVERLGLSAVIMGSRGFGELGKRSGKGRLGSVSDYCVRHCVCPVVVVRFPEEEKEGGDGSALVKEEEVAELFPVPEEELEHLDIDDEQKEKV